MKYLQARLSGYPFNRRKCRDGWYIHDEKRGIDYSQRDSSHKIWESEDLDADDWWTQSCALKELADIDSQLKSETRELIPDASSSTDYFEKIDLDNIPVKKFNEE